MALLVLAQVACYGSRCILDHRSRDRFTDGHRARGGSESHVAVVRHLGPDGLVIGRIFNSIASPPGTPWAWTLAYGFHEDRSPTHGYEPTREAAMQTFVKTWHKEG
jgi:hypothetical protein